MGTALVNAESLQSFLLYFLVPVWLCAGLGDWWMHRRQRIEATAGWPESALHVAMVGELGIAVTLALLLEINATVLVLMLCACLAHEFTLWTDLRYAAARRPIPVAEQWVHGWQIALPWVGLALLALMHSDQALAIVGLGAAPADWSLRWKDVPLPSHQVAGVMIAAAVMVVLPFTQELVRALRLRNAPIAASGRPART